MAETNRLAIEAYEQQDTERFEVLRTVQNTFTQGVRTAAQFLLQNEGPPTLDAMYGTASAADVNMLATMRQLVQEGVVPAYMQVLFQDQRLSEQMRRAVAADMLRADPALARRLLQAVSWIEQQDGTIRYEDVGEYNELDIAVALRILLEEPDRLRWQR